MEKKDLEKLAVVCLLGVIGAVAITKPELSGEAGINEGIVRWLLYSLACGLIINDQNGRPFNVIAISSFLSSISLILVICYKSIIGNVIHLSGSEISIKQNPKLFLFLMFLLLVVSFVAIVISSYARGGVLSLLDNLFKTEISKAKKIEAILNKVVTIGTVAAIIIFSIL